MSWYLQVIRTVSIHQQMDGMFALGRDDPKAFQPSWQQLSVKCRLQHSPDGQLTYNCGHSCKMAGEFDMINQRLLKKINLQMTNKHIFNSTIVLLRPSIRHVFNVHAYITDFDFILIFIERVNASIIEKVLTKIKYHNYLFPIIDAMSRGDLQSLKFSADYFQALLFSENRLLIWLRWHDDFSVSR